MRASEIEKIDRHIIQQFRLMTASLTEVPSPPSGGSLITNCVSRVVTDYLSFGDLFIRLMQEERTPPLQLAELLEDIGNGYLDASEEITRRGLLARKSL